MIVVRQMKKKETAKMGEIDRTEAVTVGYSVWHGALTARAVDWPVPPWNPDGTGQHSVAHYVQIVEQVLDGGGVAFGAFDGARLAGCAALRYGLTPTMAQLAGMWVGNGCRRQGIGTRLLSKVVRLAVASGAKELYVSATPSESAVGFYRSHEFCVAPKERVRPDLYEKEPEDIHMILAL